jgi:alkanesulfonate monooxygenase SsuD/methylene tetrahydromethanopterin reductase-like flavin-dependent oxidoreductase (luciferase family)
MARTADETGYRAVFTPEIAAREAFTTLAGFAPATRSVRLATGVVRIDRRDAQVTALAAVTLHELTGGRFLLGLGSRRSLEETRAFVGAVRTLLAEGGPAGEAVLDGPPGPGAVPVVLAALGPRMAELGGEVADGILLNWCTPDRVARARLEVARGAERAGRDPAEVMVAVYVRTCLEPDPQIALDGLRDATAQYAAMPAYRRQLDAMGLAEEAAAAASGQVPESLVRAVCAWGIREEAMDRLTTYREAGADLVVVYPVPVLEAASSILATVLGVAPDPAVEA